jgi:hypothetical protein
MVSKEKKNKENKEVLKKGSSFEKIGKGKPSGDVGLEEGGLVGEEKELLRWKAPVRPYKKRDRDYYTTIASIAFLIIVILAFLKEFLLIAVVIAFAFVSYVLAAIPPDDTEHQLTNRGIRTAGKLYRWGELQRYWISKKFGQDMIVIQTALIFPGQLLLMVGSADLGKIREILNKRLPYEEPEPTFLDRSATWLSDKIPLEKESVASQEKKNSKSSQ